MIFKLVGGRSKADRRLSKGSRRLAARSGPRAPSACQPMAFERGLEKTREGVRKSLSRGSTASCPARPARPAPLARERVGHGGRDRHADCPAAESGSQPGARRTPRAPTPGVALSLPLHYNPYHRQQRRACTSQGDAAMTPPNLLMLIVDQERRWDLTFPLVPAELQAQ